ncbi:bacillithiol system redox-active protein YtxJ [Segetibacter sp. 3557_3]|uniref:bacillithiol system redox-active protein YtxJ n=1 Tax=Segetibacter sp. 3557_3 TaxID=2547429 RepID=UPI001058B2D8|nr:bacillithiol system redox-active protein YtxJ [Segetibacter sp. 3557_3]TDH28869.1 bacillithiol system redox-active protein YtxJ [Segetibacter sp. 3557_3]
MNWIDLTSADQLEKIKADSKTKPQVIFKHSTRCSISSMAKSRLDRSPELKDADFYHLDLIAYRSISKKVAEDFNVYHESPQVLVIRDGVCVYDESHYGITVDQLTEQISAK